MSGGGGQSGGGGTTQTIQKADPWGGQQPYLLDIFQKAKDQFNAPGPTYFPGNVTAGVTPETQQAQQQLVANAPNIQGQADVAGASNIFNMTAARDVNTNPYLQSAIDAAINPITRGFSYAGGALSQDRDAAQGAGQVGGSRQGIAQGILGTNYLKQIGDTAATMASQGYQSGLDASTKAAALAPQIQQMQTTAPSVLDSVGQQKEAYTQQLINDAINKWNYEQNLPSAKLAQYQNLVQGNYGGTTSGTSTSTVNTRSNPLLTGVGGAMAGYQLGSVLFPGAGGPMGAAAGLLLGLL